MQLHSAHIVSLLTSKTSSSYGAIAMHGARPTFPERDPLRWYCLSQGVVNPYTDAALDDGVVPDRRLVSEPVARARLPRHYTLTHGVAGVTPWGPQFTLQAGQAGAPYPAG